MNPVVSISATSRPENYTARALAVVNDELSQRVGTPLVFDAREMSLAFPGHGATDDAKRLKEAIGEAPGVVIGTPEYHGGFSAMAKLVIENLGFPSALSGKPIALVGVAAGRIGAIKSLEQLRGVCSHVGGLVLPGSVSIAGVQKVFDEEGRCTDPDVEKSLRGLADSLVDYLDRHVCPLYTLESMVRGEAGAVVDV
jgi:NAD(P)H-dependent FMN reductase